MKAILDNCVVFSVSSLMILCLLSGGTAVPQCIVNPSRPCQCVFPDGTVFDAGTLSKKHLSVIVPLGDDLDEIYELSPCDSPKHFCVGEFGSVPNVSVCMKVVTTEPSVAKLIVGLVHNVSYTVVTDEPKNFTIVSKYAAITKYWAMGSEVTYMYDADHSIPTVECTNCPSDRGQFSPNLVVRSDMVKPL